MFVKADEFRGCFFCIFPYLKHNRLNLDFSLETEH